MLQFEWDARKARSNARRHEVTFEEASTVFADDLSLTVVDTFHSAEEERLVTLGMSERQRLVVVVHSEQGDHIRIISARLATAHERVNYEEGT